MRGRTVTAVAARAPGAAPRPARASAGNADGARIGPTAHYTADVWVRAGLSHPALSTWLGAVLHAPVVPLNEIYGRLSGRPTLDEMLVARHRAIDRLLEREIVAGRVEQVIEIAAGLSGRGHRFARRFPALRYVETDLPEMAAYKRRVLDRAGLRGENHEVCALDALADDGSASLAAVAADVPPWRGLAIVTEGLLSYLSRDAVLALWRRIAATLGDFPHGFYFSDLHLVADVEGMWIPELFRRGLELFAHGPVRYHFASVDETLAALRAAGFRRAHLHRPSDVIPFRRGGPKPAYPIRVFAAAT